MDLHPILLRSTKREDKFGLLSLTKYSLRLVMGFLERPEIPLKVSQEVLKKVIEFCEYHAENEFPEIEKPLKSSNMQEVVDEWDAKFVEVDMEFLFELILAAKDMEIKSLMDLTCAKVHGMHLLLSFFSSGDYYLSFSHSPGLKSDLPTSSLSGGFYDQRENS